MAHSITIFERKTKKTDSRPVELLWKKNSSHMFKTLFERHESEVYQKCLYFLKSEELATKLTKEIFFEAYTKMNHCKSERFSIRLFAITYARCVNYLNKSKADSHETERTENENRMQIEVSDSILFRMDPARLSKAMDAIKPEEKALLLLRYQDEVTEIELQELLEIDKSVLQRRLKRAKARIVETYNNL